MRHGAFRRESARNFISTSNVGYLFDDIKEVNFHDIINKEKYESYQKGIREYLDTQKNYKRRVIKFLRLNK